MSPFKMNNHRGLLRRHQDDLKELLELATAGMPPIPIETRSAERATESLADLKTGGKIRGRAVMTHQDEPRRVKHG
jgi:D-arabinose 1-dehydrogenase-like Zn-dependent alcohol dehydrogenase